MNKKIKALVIAGGTGGHVFPGYNLASHLLNMDYSVKILTDKRGFKYLKKFKDLDILVLPSSPFLSKNVFTFFSSFFLIIYSILRSIIYLTSNRPSIIFGMGGYASFPICIAASILKIKFVIYENNLIIGKANKYLMGFTKKILVSYKELEGIPDKYQNKIVEIGNIIKNDIIDFSKKNITAKNNKIINILVLGGSQAAKVFAETLPKIFVDCLSQGISLKIYQHCMPSQNENLKLFYKNNNLDFEIFNFSYNLVEYFSKVNLAITRSGSSILAELTNANIPFVSVPLPTSADNHQLKNAIYYKKKDFGFLIEEKDLKSKLIHFIKDAYENSSVLEKIINNQKQYSDKYVYNNINRVLNSIIDEKN